MTIKKDKMVFVSAVGFTMIVSGKLTVGLSNDNQKG